MWLVQTTNVQVTLKKLKTQKDDRSMMASIRLKFEQLNPRKQI